MEKFLFLHEDDFDLQKSDKDYAVPADRIFYGTEDQMIEMADDPASWIKFKPLGHLHD